jgi:hypothetical protein
MLSLATWLFPLSFDYGARVKTCAAPRPTFILLGKETFA